MKDIYGNERFCMTEDIENKKLNEIAEDIIRLFNSSGISYGEAKMILEAVDKSVNGCMDRAIIEAVFEKNK